MHRVKLAGLGAVAEADTGEGAHLAASSAEEHGRAAVLRSVVAEAELGRFRGAAAGDEGHHFVRGVIADAHDLGDSGRRGLAARDAAVGRGLPSRNRGGVAVAAGEAAAAAVGAGQTFTDLGLFRVDFHMEDLGSICQQRSEDGAQHAQYDDCKED